MRCVKTPFSTAYTYPPVCLDVVLSYMTMAYNHSQNHNQPAGIHVGNTCLAANVN